MELLRQNKFKESKMILEDFEAQSDSTFDDFNTSNSEVIPNTAINSNRNRAAMSIGISNDPERAAAQYSSALDELETTGNSATLEKINAQAQQQVHEFSQESLVDGLLDPEIPDDVKLNMANNHKAVIDTPISTQELFIEKNLIDDGGELTAEQAVVRESLTDIVRPYWENRAEAQKLMDSNIANLDTSTAVAMADMIELYLVPTAYNTQTKSVLDGMVKALNTGDTTGFTDWLLAGNSRMDITKMINSVPPENRLPLQAALIDIINSESSIYLPGDNDYAKFDMMRSTVLGDYSETDQVIDNIVGVLDLIPGISLLGKGIKYLNKGGDVTKSAVVGSSRPASVGKVTVQTNPAKGYTMVDEAMKNDEVAETLFGTSSKDVAVEAMGPKPLSSVGEVDPLPSHLDKPPVPDKNVIETMEADGQIHYTTEEKLSAVEKLSNAFQNTVGLKYRSELSQVGTQDGSFSIKAVYTAGDTGFSSSTDARNQVKFALRDSGITDSEITILKRDASGYNKAEDTEGLGDYIAQVDFKSKINPSDVTEWSGLDVKRNLFDKVGMLTGSGKSGSFQRHILDAHSTLNPTLTMGANVAVDKGALMARRITDLGEEFGNTFRKMKPDEQVQVENYIKEANLKGIEDTPAQLMAKGFNDKAIKALTAWRKTWDTVYWLENADLVRTLKAGGFKSLKTDSDNLLVRKVQMDFSNSRVYNPETKKVETLTPDDMRSLYNQGGYVGQSRSHLALDGEDITHVIVKEDTNFYATGLRETDPVLNYRKGYYQVNYDAPKFIDKIVRDKNGKELYRQAVGMARDNVEAQQMLSKWAKAEGVPEDTYGVVRDNKNNERMSTDDNFDVQSAQGRSSQRVRGERLQEATQPFTGGIDGTLVQDPIDALTHAARSIGNRVSMRDWLESSKTRFTKQFAHLIPEVKGQRKFPRNINTLKASDATSKSMADARTTWEYINYMENGYINSLDDTLKGTMRAIGNIMGNAGYGKSQRVMEWMASGRGVTGAAKGTAFQLYIALNPLRQMLVQSHQMVRLAAMNPTYAATKMSTDLMKVQGARLTGKTNDLHKFVMDSGQIDSITRSNLLQDSLVDITHQSKRGFLGNPKSAAVRGSRAMQKVGFEAGESNNVITSLLSFRDQAIKAGKDVTDLRVRDEIYAQARNFTYNMTKAGDMPYNQNSLGIIMQFLQVPHKAITQGLFNRALTRKQRASALMFDTVMFGIPAYWGAEVWFGENLPDDPKLREAMQFGIEGMMFNSMLNVVADEHSELDYTSLSPTSGQGFADLFTRTMEEGMFALVSKSPSGQLVFGSNPRITNFVKNIAAFSGAIPEYTPIELSSLARGFIGLSSGMSNAFKMKFAQKYGQVVSSTGNVIDEHVTSAEAIGILFGLPPEDAAEFYRTNDKAYTKSQAFQDDIKAQYKEVKRQLALAGGNKEASETVLETMNIAWMVFGEDEIEARKAFTSLIKRDLKNGDVFLVEKMFKLSGIMSYDDWRRLVQDSPITEDKKKELLNIGEQLQNYKSEE